MRNRNNTTAAGMLAEEIHNLVERMKERLSPSLSADTSNLGRRVGLI
jgi:hypothetical protein